MQNFRTKDIVYTGAAAALIAVGAWISIPVGVVPVTLQTLVICLTAGLLGLKRGALATLIYLLLGAVGVPVFAGFRGGLGVLLGATGGYLIGFLFTALLVGYVSDKTDGKLPWLLLSMVTGIALCYAFGTLWFALVFAKNGEPKTLGSILSVCVLPFLLPDAVKAVLAALLVRRLRPHLK